MLSQQLEVFLTTVECGSFSKAARRLLVTPASVMKHMNTLEARLGLKLLERGSHGIELTAAGRSLYRDGKKLMQQARTALARAADATRAQGITIRVGSSLLNPGSVLTSLWEPLRARYPQYKFRIIPYEDTKEQILSEISSLGERIDLLVGVFNSRAMHSLANYLVLGQYRLCVAVPRQHPLAAKEQLTIRDLHGEHLMMVRSGDTEVLDHFHDMLKLTHPQILVEETGYFYDVDTFNTCEQNGALLLTLDAWAGIHPSLVTLPVDWPYTIPYGLLYARQPAADVEEFVDILHHHAGG